MVRVSRYENLFSPGRIGNLEIRNRIVYPAMGANICPGGFVSERLKGYHEALAKGGVGLSIVENAIVKSDDGGFMPGNLLVGDDKFIPGLRELARLIKRNGSRACLQLSSSFLIPAPGQRPVFGIELPRELTVEQIESLIDCFVKGAVRAADAGFDAVEVHGAHIVLGGQFRSGLWNLRQDKYGGNARKRANFLVGIIASIKKKLGKDFVVWPRIAGQEVLVAGGNKTVGKGITLEETLQDAPLYQAAGADAIHVSAAGYRNYAWVYCVMSPVLARDSGAYLPWTEEVKKAVDVPVIAVGRISPELGDMAIKEGKADFVAMGRALQCDPELPNKVASGRKSEIRPCIRCNHCIETFSTAVAADGVQCVVNPSLGRTKEFSIKPTTAVKNVVVAGGGPAGMEAARVAAQRGHAVTLYEKEMRLGGQLIAAAMPPERAQLKSFITYQSHQLNKLGVKLEMGKALTPEEVDEINPDVVILATGVKPKIPEIYGLNVHPNVVTALDVLLGKVEVGERVAIIGGERVGCECADFLAEKGKKVTVARRGPRMATRMTPDHRLLILDRLAGKNVCVYTGIVYLMASDRGLAVHTWGGDVTIFNADAFRFIPADTIVLAAGATPNRDLLPAIQGKSWQVRTIGDCVEPRGIYDAVREGWLAANDI